MDGKRENHFHFGDIGGTLVLVVLVLIAGAFFLWQGIGAGDPLAIVVTTALVVLGLLGIGVGLTLFILNTAARQEEKRSLVEQSRTRDDALENLAIMGGMQKVQNQQNAMLLKQARDAQRALPPPDGDVIDAGFTFDPAIFEDLEMED